MAVVCVLWLVVLLPLGAIAEEPKLPPLHHVFDIEPPAAMQVPAELPLHEGKVACATCHGVKDIERTPIAQVDKNAPNFLRGGPYRPLTELCYRCHEKQGYERPNIHKLLDAQGKYDEKDCEYCHKKAPDPAKEIERAELEFRLPPSKLCYGCHLKTPHLNALNHLVKPEKAMREYMEKSEKKLGVILPLDEQGRIQCATCHSPHPKGLIDPAKPAGRQVADADLDDGIGYRDDRWGAVYARDKKARLDEYTKQTGRAAALAYRRIDKELLLRLPAKDGALCRACHRFDK